ncbi:uncharacterized protein LOC127263700 [Andrographis paniculata]|uniref:uncharacterized protein LOC127263700 n=1 Tax=Andrographis paniculata TaxID=175694 RepID=UPI0021E70D79|nr:uncharacterized protein LOC127263700 [Andrographis paniculata]
MTVTLLETQFLSNPVAATFKLQRGALPVPAKRISVSCRRGADDDSDSLRQSENRLVKLALVAVAAGVLTLGSVDPASAGKSGGRVGGQAFRSAPAAPPRASGPRVGGSRTNVFINPPVAPPLVGGYGYGYGAPFYGGWGWSPFSFFAPGPSVAVGVGGGFDLFALIIFLSIVSGVVRRFFRSREDDDDY